MNIEFIQSQLKHCHWAYHPEHAEVPVEVITRHNAQAIYYRTRYAGNINILNVAIAGTNEIRDLVNAAYFCGKNNRHKGFYYHSLRIKKALERIIQPNDHVVITGHSLGGVAAQFISLDMWDWCKSIKVISFGAPKGFRKPFPLPPRVHWTIIRGHYDLIPDFPFFKPFNWLTMMEKNRTGNVYHVHLPYDDVPSSFPQRMFENLRPSLLSTTPILTSYQTIGLYHSLSSYETSLFDD